MWALEAGLWSLRPQVPHTSVTVPLSQEPPRPTARLSFNPTCYAEHLPAPQGVCLIVTCSATTGGPHLPRRLWVLAAWSGLFLSVWRQGPRPWVWRVWNGSLVRLPWT